MNNIDEQRQDLLDIIETAMIESGYGVIADPSGNLVIQIDDAENTQYAVLLARVEN